MASDILIEEMHHRSAFRGFPVAGMAVAGAVLGHWLGYLLAIPDPHLRAEVLGQSGHGYWTLGIQAALLFGFAALGAVLLRFLRGTGHGEASPEDRPALLALRLALVQVSAFVAMEIAERLIVGEAVTEVFQHHILLLGITVQVAVACVGALILLWFGRVAARVCRRIASSPIGRSRPRHSLPALLVALPPQVLHGGTGLRGPPSH